MLQLLRLRGSILGRGSILLALGLVALAIGLLAMHTTSAATHSSPASSSIASHSPTHDSIHTVSDGANNGGPLEPGTGGQHVENAGQCGETCDSGMAMAGTCLLALTLAGLLWLRPPHSFSQLRPQTTFALPHSPIELFTRAARPSLIKLSINRA